MDEPEVNETIQVETGGQMAEQGAVNGYKQKYL